MRTTLQIQGIKAARERVDDMGDRARKPEPALRSAAVRMALQQSERRRFTRYRFKPASPAWVARKRREGLPARTMQASGRLRAALENAEAGTTRLNVFNGILTWGLRQGGPGSVGFYAMVQAGRGRRAVVIDRVARKDIAQRVESFLANGFIR